MTLFARLRSERSLTHHIPLGILIAGILALIGTVSAILSMIAEGPANAMMK